MLEVPSFASLFCGCGGFDLGFLNAGYRCLAALDIDRIAVEHHQKNLRSDAAICDLTAGWPYNGSIGRLDVVLAGTPCQGFSTAGNRKIDDPRNDLLLVAGKIATKLRPKVFVAENVGGVTAGEHKVYWETLRRIMRSAGYRSADAVCLGTSMGVAQIRRRVVMIAWNTPADLDLNFPIIPGGTLRSALRNVRRASSHDVALLPTESELGRIASCIKPGQKLSNVRAGPRAVHTWQIPLVFGHTSAKEKRILEALLHARRRQRRRETGDADPVEAGVLTRILGEPVAESLRVLETKGFVRRVNGMFDLAHTFNGKFRRLEWDRPSHTVDTRFGNARYFLHPDENRGFSVREAARLQGFPDTYTFCGPISAQFRMIGNAVAPPVAQLLAIQIKRLL